MKAQVVNHPKEVADKGKRPRIMTGIRRGVKKSQAMTNVIKVVGANGQISLGKAYAGKSVEISKPDENTIVIKTGRFIPDNEKWLYEGDNIARLDRAIASAAKREVNHSNFEELMAIFERRIAEK